MKYRITWVFRPYSISDSYEIEYDNWSEALLYETGIHSDAYALVNAKLTLNSQDEATFSFIMPPSHEHYDRIEARVGYIIFWQDDEIICKGRIDTITVDLNGAKNISGFGNLGLLKEALISQSSRKWIGTYQGNVYESPTRSSMFHAFYKSDSVRLKVQRILDIANGQLCDQQMTGYNRNFQPDPGQTVYVKDPYTTIYLGNCSAHENVNGINISNTNSAGGAQEGLYINAKYETFDNAFQWFKDELIAKTECQIECSFVPIASDSGSLHPPYAMTLNVFGREGMVRTTAAFRAGWNILDYRFSDEKGDDFCTILLPFGEDDSRVSTSISNIEDKTGYEEIVDSKMTIECDKVENVFIEPGFPIITIDESFVRSVQTDETNPAKIFVLYRRWYETDPNPDLPFETRGGIERPTYLYEEVQPTTPAGKLRLMNGYRVYKVYSDSDKDPHLAVSLEGGTEDPEHWTWCPDSRNITVYNHGNPYKEHWDRLTTSEMTHVHETQYEMPDSTTAQLPATEISISNGITFAIKPPYIIWKEGLAKYGPIVRKEDFSTKSRSAILNYGIDTLRKIIASSFALTVRAIDPHLVDPNYASARVASRVPVMLPEYEGEMVICTKTIDISNPGNCLIEFNKKPEYLVDIVKENVAMIKRAYAAKRYTRILNGDLVPQENGLYDYDP